MQKLMGLVRRCVDDYNMISEGDKIAVGVSGGKDSLVLLVLLAALTSSIAMMETAVSALYDRFHWSRRTTCLIVVGITVALGIPSSLGNGVWSFVQPFGLSLMDFFDFVGNNVLMPIVALFTCLFVGYAVGPEVLIAEARLQKREAVLFRTVVRYVAPVLIVLILVTSLLDALSISSF